MIYITGDIHIPTHDIQKLNRRRFPEQKTMSENDYIIICGDFGGIWSESPEERYWIKWLSDKNFTTLFIDGNHENFELLNQYETVDFHGGTAHKITNKIYHLMRGEIYELCGKRIFTLGGASSHDKEYRTEGKNWWSCELPSEKELHSAKGKLSDFQNTVDIIITHCAPTSIQKLISPMYETNILTDFLECVKQTVSYNDWFFGHYHIDMMIDKKHTAIFNKIISL